MLHHVTLEITPDAAERSAEFWEILGFRSATAPDPIAAYVSWFEAEGTQVHLIQTPEPAVPPIGHAAVIAPDFDRVVERLQDAGFEVADARPLWGKARAFAIAPGGHRVELMAAPP